MGDLRYVSDFEFPSDRGFSGSIDSSHQKMPKNVHKKGGHITEKMKEHGKKMGYQYGGTTNHLYKKGGKMGYKNGGKVTSEEFKMKRGKQDDMDHANVQRPKKLAATQRDQEFGNQGELKPGFKKGGKNWIQDAIKKPGSLRKSLKVKTGEKIPSKKLDKAAEKGGKLGRRARLAETLRGFNKAKGGEIKNDNGVKKKARAVAKEVMKEHESAKPPRGHGVKAKAKGGFNSKPMYGKNR